MDNQQLQQTKPNQGPPFTEGDEPRGWCPFVLLSSFLIDLWRVFVLWLAITTVGPDTCEMDLHYPNSGSKTLKIEWEG